MPGGNGNEIVLLNKTDMADNAPPANVLKAHLWAMVALAWTFAAGRIVLLADLPLGPPFRLLLTVCSIFALVFFVGLVVGFLPSLLIWWLARHYVIGAVWYFLAAGALAGAGLSAMLVTLRSDGAFGLPPDPALAEAATGLIVLTALSGAVGGFVFWWTIGRFIRKAATLPVNA